VKLLIIVCLTVVCKPTLAALTAKVLMVRGDATKLSPGKIKAEPILKGDVLVEDTSVVTQPKSFVRLRFSDNSTMNVAPKSMAVISKMPKDKASVVKLLNGIVKAEVEKQTTTQTKTKMIVKTPNAVLGVRGTKFQSIYNPTNKTTSLVTVEGQVAMKKEAAAPLSTDPKNRVDEVDQLDQSINSGEGVVEVTQGKYTGLSDNTVKPIEPVKIAPEQYDALAKSMGSNKKAEDVMKITDDAEVQAAKASKIKSGGYVDFDTGLYVPPASNAKLNAQTGTYEAPRLGKIDETGDFIPPKGVRVDDKKGLVIDEKELATLASKEDQEEIKATVLQVKKAEKDVPLVVNKVKAQKTSKPAKSWGPKNHILSAKLMPYSEVLTIKNKRNGSKANVSSEGARNFIFAWKQVWSKKWSSRLRMGITDYDFSQDGINIRYYGEQDDSNEYLSLGAIYQLNTKAQFSLDLVDRQAFYLVGNSGNSSNEVEFRTNYLQTLEFGVQYEIKSYENIGYFFTAMYELGLDVNAPAQNNELGAEHSGLTLGVEAQWQYSKKLGINPSAFYHSLETNNDDFNYDRKALGFGLDFIYDI
tara:strand:- start:757 stop:2508 length:1752 start_codon:yes stop_codon:yes gene_type:complete